MKHHNVYLASASPRRRQLLDQVGIAYTLIKTDVDESLFDEPDPGIYTQQLALLKALDGHDRMFREKPIDLPIIAADTAVVIKGQILGKPDNFEHASEMLMLLSNGTHEVYSSVCVIHGAFRQTATQISTVRFRKITRQETVDYWNTGEPWDKSGAYAIQGQAARFISHLSGSYSGVMGLPLYELIQLLDKSDQ